MLELRSIRATMAPPLPATRTRPPGDCGRAIATAKQRMAAPFTAQGNDLARPEGLDRPGPSEDEGGRMAAAHLTLTEAGRSVLAGETDRVSLNGIDRWWAGTRLIGRDVWRYDRNTEGLVPPASSDA